MKITHYDNQGNKLDKTFELDSIFDIEPNLNVISQYNYVYLANQRYANAKAKDRSGVSGGGKKPWKQKGTGRARHGSTRSPIWKGGGITFGPTGNQNYKLDMPKKMKKLAFRSVVSLKGSENKIVMIDNPEITKTSAARDIIKSMNSGAKKYTIIQGDKDNLHLAFRNIKNLNIIRIGELSVNDLLNGGLVVMLSNTVDQFTKLGK